MNKGAAIAAVTGLLVLVAGCDGKKPGVQTAMLTTPPHVSVAIEVTTTEADATKSYLPVASTLALPTGTEQKDDALPIRTQYAFAPGDTVSASFQKKTDWAGSITCKIVVAGKVLAENTSSGEYAVVSCSATV